MKERISRNLLPDYTLLFVVSLLTVIGIVMVYSASYVWADFSYGDPYFFIKRQVIFSIVGIGALIFFYYFPYYILRKYVTFILVLSFVLLIAVLIPGIGIVRGGAQSWIGVGAFSIQPAEFAKLALILFLANYLAVNKHKMDTFIRGFLIPVSLTVITFMIIMQQPDFGTGIVLVGTCMMMIFIAGARFIYFLYFAIIGLVGLTLLIISAPYRLSRITAFLNPWSDPLGDGFQIIQSLYALGPGKLLGVGFGMSIQKYFYLPEPQTDFIFAIIGEELGFIGAIFIIILFYILSLRGLKIAINSVDPFACYVAVGIIAMISLQFIVNISVVIGLIPVTGITLPLLSYGGSSLTLTLGSIGILLNISKYTTKI